MVLGVYKKVRRKFIKKYFFPKHRRIVKLIPKNSKVLDLGCGDGRLSRTLLKRGCKVTGCDTGKLNLGLKNFNYIQADLNEKFPFKEKFDVVIFSDVLEHLKKPKEVLEKSAKISDHIIVSIPNQDYFLYKIFPKLENPPGDLEHLHHWNLDSFKKRLQSDLKIKRVEYCSDFPEVRWVNFIVPNKKFFHQTIIMSIKKVKKRKRIKLAYVAIRFSPELGGPTYHLLKELSNYIDVVCIATGQEYKIKKTKRTERINPHFKIRRFNYKQLLSSDRDFIIPTNLGKILNEEKPDIVQGDEFFRIPTIKAASWCKKNNIPFILNSRMRYRPGFLRNFALWIFKLLASKAVKYASYVIATQGKCSKDEFLRWFPRKKNIVIIPTGIDIKKFTKNASKKEIAEFRKKYKIPNKKIILDVARIYPVKRIDLLVKAFSIVKKHYDCVLVIVGPAETREKQRIDDLIKKLGLKIGKDIIFTGPIKNENIGPAYASASVFVNTSETEGICFSFLESMCFKLPIIAFNVGGNSGVVEQGKNGFLLRFGDIKGIADKILKILKDEKLRKKLGNYGYKKLQKEFDIKTNAKKLINIFKVLV